MAKPSRPRGIVARFLAGDDIDSLARDLHERQPGHFANRLEAQEFACRSIRRALKKARKDTEHWKDIAMDFDRKYYALRDEIEEQARKL